MCDITEGKTVKSMERGERQLILSSGFVKNWELITPSFMIEELLIKDNMKSLDILDEIFFSIKKDSLDDYLKYDASAIILEAHKNAIIQM